MMMILAGFKYFLSYLLIAGLAMSSALFGILLYKKITGQEALAGADYGRVPPSIQIPITESSSVLKETNTQPKDIELKKSILIEAPLVLQNPELPSGCELTALTMLLQFYGVKKGKMDLLPEMKTDNTPIHWGKNGAIEYWGNPNLGYVGDITGKQKGFGIYHKALFELLATYIPTAVDLTGSPFNKLQEKLSDGTPVVVWTTIPFTVPRKEQWVIWDSPLGPIRTTFLEHAVLLVGYDDSHVYVNDPLSGKKNYQIEKEQFIKTWEAMGRQSLTYEKREA
jgi:uncharacterized protein YvpB